MENNTKYPIYFMQLDDDQMKFGVNDIALVDSPAYESMFLKFKEEKEVKFAIQNEEQRIITGAVMIPDKLIYREEKGKPYYVTATKDTIFEASQKFMRENRNNNMKLTHDVNTNTSDVFIFESFVTDENRVKSVNGFESMPLGTWFITCKVLSDNVWNDIKGGKFNGFSLEALFKMQPIVELDEEDMNKVLQAIN